MPFAAKWMDLELITLNEVLQVRERQISHDITYSGILNNDMNELIYKTEIDSQTLSTNIWVLKGKGGGREHLGVCNEQIHTTVYKTNQPKGPTV